MNKYFIELADTYLMLAEKGEIPKEEAERKRAVYAFLGTSSDDMIYDMFDSGAFNSIVKGYVALALKNADTDKKTADAVKQELHILFDTIKAKQADTE
jgi:hypothetical protein